MTNGTSRPSTVARCSLLYGSEERKLSKSCGEILRDVGHQLRMILYHMAATGLLDDSADFRTRPGEVPLFEHRMGTDSDQPAQIGVMPCDSARRNSLGPASCKARRGQPSQRRSTPLPLNVSCLAANENGAEGRSRDYRGQGI